MFHNDPCSTRRRDANRLPFISRIFHQQVPVQSIHTQNIRSENRQFFFYGPCEGVPDGQHGSHCDFSPFTTVGTVLGSEVVIAVCFIFNSQNALAFAT
jgi:hypothetical protein